MTIPSLGGGKNAKSFIKILNTPATDSSIVDLVNEHTDPELVKDSAISQSIQETEKNSNSEQIQQPEMINNQSHEESVQNFRKEYERILHNTVLPAIAPYEKERKTRFTAALINAIIFGILAVITYFYVPVEVDRDGYLTWGCIAIAGGVWFWLKKSFERKIKSKIMPKLMKAFPGFYWQKTQAISTEEIDNIKIFPNSKKCTKKFDDAFLGKYRDVEINIAECEYELGGGNNKQEIFNGAVIRLKMNKNVEGLTVLRPKKINCKDLTKPKKDKKDPVEPIALQKVELEDVEFNKNYNIHSTDQIESRYLLTTGFMERFNKLSFAFHSKGTYCVFFNKYVYIAPHVKGDLFGLFSLRKPVTDTKQFDEMFNQIASVLELVDYFKLDQKLGL